MWKKKIVLIVNKRLSVESENKIVIIIIIIKKKKTTIVVIIVAQPTIHCKYYKIKTIVVFYFL